jgi:hypothetical protein
MSEKMLTNVLSFVNHIPPELAYNSTMTTELAPDLKTGCRASMHGLHLFFSEQHIDICICSSSPCTGRGLGEGLRDPEQAAKALSCFAGFRQLTPSGRQGQATLLPEKNSSTATADNV